jgi:hypothetical protein
MLGAQLLYNLMLARKRRTDHDGSSEAVEDWESRIEAWEAAVGARAGELQAWDPDEFWGVVATSGARVPAATGQFIRSWVNFIQSNVGDLGIGSDQRCADWVYTQECAVKKNQARLVNTSMLLAWGGESGAEPLNYRWRITRQYADEVGGARRV